MAEEELDFEDSEQNWMDAPSETLAGEKKVVR
jgi:hypothetical protein